MTVVDWADGMDPYQAVRPVATARRHLRHLGLGVGHAPARPPEASARHDVRSR